jgi:hypothetical protein
VTTYIKTNKGTKYVVEDIVNGLLVVRQPSGKKRTFGPRYVGRARYDAAVSRFWTEKQAADAATAKAADAAAKAAKRAAKVPA